MNRMKIALLLFGAGIVTIVLPCILPLVPIVLGVSVAGRSRWRPLLVVLGMVLGFVGLTFGLHVALRGFAQLADFVRLGAYSALLLLGVGLLTDKRYVGAAAGVLSGLFFLDKGWLAVVVASFCGVGAMALGGRVAARIQQLGANTQARARTGLGEDSPLTALVIGATLGLVWVPCAGPALGFALTLVRQQPGLQALGYLTAYALGTAVPLLAIGWGGQKAVRSVRRLTRYSGTVQRVAGALLALTALAFRLDWFVPAETWLAARSGYGTLGAGLEQRLIGGQLAAATPHVVRPAAPTTVPVPQAVQLESADAQRLPRLGQAPEFVHLGPWYNSAPLQLRDLRGRVVLVDFWTYSCVNCVRTLPHIQGWWDAYRSQPFIVVGVHAPEFEFEKDSANVAGAVRKLGLTYPVAQDNELATWDAFDNRYWPAKYLIDSNGFIRFAHFGEGGYAETDRAIRSLLEEIGHKAQPAAVAMPTSGLAREQTPETYLNPRNWTSLQNRRGEPTDAALAYHAPATLGLHAYALDGRWQLVDQERQVLRSDEGAIRLRFLGAEVNLVLGLAAGANPVPVDVEVDGAAAAPFVVSAHDLYRLWQGSYGEHELVLHFHGSGVEAYAFTFGS